MATFEHSYGWALPMILMGMGPGLSRIEVGDGTLRVVMGWGFAMRAPLEEIESATVEDRPISWRFGIGVHGWPGEWAVNASRRNHVLIKFKRAQRARVIGFPVRVRVLHLSPAEPEALVASLSRNPLPA